MEDRRNNRRWINIGIIVLLVFILFLFLDRSAKNATGPEFEDTSNNIESVTWKWASFSDPVQSYNIDNPDNYTITVSSDGKLNIVADCNSANTTVKIEGNSVSVQEPVAMTMAMCPPESKSDEFIKNLTNAATYFIKDGVLYVDLFADSGTMVFVSGDTQIPPSNNVSSDPENATYLVGGQDVAMSNGKNEEPIPDSSTVITTEIWGEPTTKNIEGTSVGFAAVTLLQQPGGSGSFYYIAACVNMEGGCTGTNAIMIGDRITMQTVEIHGTDTIVVNYMDRAEGEPMSSQPSVAASKSYKLQGTTLTEAANNF